MPGRTLQVLFEGLKRKVTVKFGVMWRYRKDPFRFADHVAILGARLVRRRLAVIDSPNAALRAVLIPQLAAVANRQKPLDFGFESVAVDRPAHVDLLGFLLFPATPRTSEPWLQYLP